METEICNSIYVIRLAQKFSRAYYMYIAYNYTRWSLKRISPDMRA